jgi:hypothetical protein
MTIEPDTKDWTWVLERRCDECGFDAAAVPTEELSGRLLASAGSWVEVLVMQPGARDRPDERTWSPLEYGAHVRDVHRVMVGRLRSMLDEEDPQLDAWDQDAAAVEGGYDELDPAEVAEDLAAEARVAADLVAELRDDQWDRPGRRSDGSAFTAGSLVRYWLHDVEHHLYDVRRSS